MPGADNPMRMPCCRPAPLHCGCVPTHSCAQGDTPLLFAVCHNHQAVVERLIQEGADIGAKDVVCNLSNVAWISNAACSLPLSYALLPTNTNYFSPSAEPFAQRLSALPIALTDRRANEGTARQPCLPMLHSCYCPFSVPAPFHSTTTVWQDSSSLCGERRLR